MKLMEVEELVGAECEVHPHEMEDYETETPRWCKGCGDHGVLQSIQKVLRDQQIDPERVVAVSGIGCSSRLPHYLRTYGFHGIHGRALPISMGVKIGRPDLTVMTVMGDGDCFSIGAGHWVHAIRYNPDIKVFVLDNGVYALTKKQASPTSQAGQVTNTTPYGAYLLPMNPLSIVLGITNVSFVAQTSTWNPIHMEDTIRRAWDHRGLAFVRIMQRCPVFMPDVFTLGSTALTYLEHEEGIPVDATALRNAGRVTHDPRDLNAAQKIVLSEDPMPVGLIYWNPDVPSYEDVRYSHSKPVDRPTYLNLLNEQLDKFTVHARE